MSFVLDALKLSEERRSRFSRPVYAHPPPVHRRVRRRRWVAVLAAAPIIAGAFLAWRLVAPWSPAPLPEPPQGAEVPTVVEPNAANAGRTTMGGLQETGGIDPAIRGGATPAPTAKEQPAAAVAVSAPAAQPAPATLATEQADPPPLDAVPPGWPPLTLQMLFYSPDRARSFVQINGRNYRVGERLDDGPELLTIAPNGVILSHRGAVVRLAMDR